MATHLTVHKTPGLGDYTTIQAAITASSNGTAEDRSTVTILDAATYDERLTVGRDFIDIIAAADCVLAPTTVGNVITFTAAGTVRFLTENDAKPTIAPSHATLDGHVFYFGNKAVKLHTSWRVRLDNGADWILMSGIGGPNTQTLSGVVILPGTGTWRQAQVVGGGAAAALTITDCDLYEIPNLAPKISGTTQLIVERSRIRTSSLAAGTAGAAPASRIVNNIITHHHSGGDSSLIAGPALPAAGALVAHNMLIGSGLTGGAAIAPAFSTTQFVNNVVVNFQTAGVTIGTTITPTARNNCLFNCANAFDSGWDVAGTITADPLINGDIDPDSPCVDAGIDLPTVTDDYLGRERPQGEGWDIGPYELPYTPPIEPDPDMFMIPFGLGSFGNTNFIYDIPDHPPIPPDPDIYSFPYGIGPYGGSYHTFDLPASDLILYPFNTSTVIAKFSTVPPSDYVTDINNWTFTNLAPYPINITVQSVTYPDSGDPLQASLTVTGMTAIQYEGAVTLDSGILSAKFLGEGSYQRAIIQTPNGPLVKDWGDNTPATIDDVHVYVGRDKTEVPITGVNPYTGTITLQNPIPSLYPGDPDAQVFIDYCWIKSPTFPIRLNTPGSVLNEHGGLIPKGRFPMQLVIGPNRKSADPLLIGWRHIGFDKAGSTLLNTPTSLRLNQSNAVDAVPFFRKRQPSSVYAWEAPLITDGFNYRHVDFTNTGALIAVTTRFEITDIDQTDGVFTGVGFGYCGSEFCVAGALIINGLKHVGLLKDITRPDLVESWILGPQVIGTILIPDRPDGLYNRIQVNTKDIPYSLKPGDRFQILDGSQKGIYEILSSVTRTDGTTWISINNKFPADPRVYGNKNPVMLFETPWNERSTYYLNLDVDGYVCLAMSKPIIKVHSDDIKMDMADSARFQNLRDGIWFGQLFDENYPKCDWSFVRYNVRPKVLSYRTASIKRHGFNSEGQLTDGFNYLSKKGYHYEQDGKLVFDGINYNAKVYDTFLDTTANFEVNFKLSQDYSVRPGLVFMASDGKREYAFGTLSYIETDQKRQIVELPSVNDWQVFSLDSLTPDPIDNYQYNSDQEFHQYIDIKNHRDEGGRAACIKLKFNPHSLISDDGLSSLYFGADVSKISHIRLRFKRDTVLITDLTGTVLGEFDFGWNDGLYHTYQIVSNGKGQVSVYADNHLYWQGRVQDTGINGDVYYDKMVYGVEAKPGCKSLATWIPVHYVMASTSDIVGLDYRISQTDKNLLYAGNLLSGKRVIKAKVKIGETSFDNDQGLSPVVMTLGNIRLRWGSGFVAMTDQDNQIIQTYPFNWKLNEAHTYQIKSVSGITSLIIDNTIQLPTVPIDNVNGPAQALYGTLPTGSCEVYWNSVLANNLPSDDVKHTVGIFTNDNQDGDLLNIDNWQLPRTDPYDVKNSELIGPVIKQVDWTSGKEFRLSHTPEWGLIVYIPALGSPPWHEGHWVNTKSLPLSGWINVEYADLPKTDKPSGFQFGICNDNNAVQRWEWLRTRLFKPQDPNYNYVANNQMVLNRHSVGTSGEMSLDTSLENVTVQILNKRQVSLKPTHIYAKSIYKIIDGINVLTRESWNFDRKTQIVTLNDDKEFTSDRVTVVFIPGTPVTETYLRQAPLLDSATLLNERTPPFVKSDVSDLLLVDLTITDKHVLDLTDTFALDVIKITDQKAQKSYGPNDWVFDQKQQTVTLNDPYEFSNLGNIITVEYKPRKEYLMESIDPNDNTTYAYHISPPHARYRDVKIITKTNDGQTGLIATIHEDALSIELRWADSGELIEHRGVL